MKFAPLVLVLLLLFVRNLGAPIDYDLWYHLRIGEEIERTGAVPHFDTLTGGSEKAPPHYYVNDEWGLGFLVWKVYSAGGYPGLAVALAGLIALLGLAVFAACRAGGASPVAGALWVLLADGLMQTRYALRPHLLTQLAAATTIWILLRAERSARPRRWLWWLVPLFVLWSNVHAGVSLGVGLLGLWCLNGLRSKVLTWRVLWLPVLGCGMALFCRPDGHRLPMYVLTHFRRPQVYQWVMEWQPLASVMPRWWAGPLTLFLILAVVGFVWAWRGAVLRPVYLAATAFLTYFTFRWVRALGELGAVGVPLVASTWASLPLPFKRSRDSLLPPILLSLALLGGLVWELSQPDHFRFEPSPEVYPVGAVEFLERHPARVIFNSNQFGGYLVFRHQRPYFHSVMSAIPDQVLSDYFALRQHPERLGEMVERYGLDAFLLHYEYLDDQKPLIATLAASPDWSLVYFDELSVLFMPSRLGLPAYQALNPARPDPLGPDLALARQELERHLAEQPKDPRGWQLWANLGERLPDPALQAEGYQKVLELRPDNVPALLGRARLRFAARDLDGALRDSRQAVRLAPRYAPARYNLAVALASQGDNDGARRELERCLELDPGFQPAAALLQRL